MYVSGSGESQKDKINVEFFPDGDNPAFVIYDADLIEEHDREVILNYIVQQDCYTGGDYSRTVESMLVEWDAHTDYFNSKLSKRVDSTFGWTTREQAKHVHFDRDSEGLPYLEYYFRAAKIKLQSLF